MATRAAAGPSALFSRGFELNTPAHNDASPTIRGFVYQLLLTVLRLLQLKEGELLRIEYAEDVDVFGRSLADGLPERVCLE